jgi:hypothetical protein
MELARERLEAFFKRAENLQEVDAEYKRSQTRESYLLTKFVLSLHKSKPEEWVEKDSVIWDTLLRLEYTPTPIEACLGPNHPAVRHRDYYGCLE